MSRGATSFTATKVPPDGAFKSSSPHQAPPPPQHHTSATRERSRGVMEVLLLPLLALVFGLLHVAYQVVLLIRSSRIAIKNSLRRGSDRKTSSFTSLQDLLDAHDCPHDGARAPNNLAVVLAQTAPSSIRLYVSTLLMRLTRRTDASKANLWREFKTQHQAALEAKYTTDIATIIHLARISGVQRLSVYTEQLLSPAALQALRTALQVEYKTKAVFSEQIEDGTKSAGGNADTDWSRYAQLRRRLTTAKHNDDSSSGSSPGSPASSSDSEAGVSSLDETLASSYTADDETFDALVDVHIGLHPTRPRDESALQVTLLSQSDGHDRFAEMVSDKIREEANTYLSTILVADIDSQLSSRRRFSASTLRKAWVSKRDTFTSELTVSHLDAALSQVGYMDEPDLLIVFGGKRGLRKLYGFPAWPMRVTELFYDETMQPKKPYRSTDYVAALRKLAKMQQRFGK